LDFVFLGTGSAWGVPEMGCSCRICQKMRSLNEERTRSAFLLLGEETILMDCGPDIRRQLNGYSLKSLDAILISHEHADHFLGLDELVAFRRRVPREKWQPIPTYATKAAWAVIKKTFGYLLEALLEPRIIKPGERLQGLKTTIYPFKTFHGDSAPGSVGFIVEEEVSGRVHKLVYTSDFLNIPKEDPRLLEPDFLILQSHWLNEPLVNRAHSMSLQRGLDFVEVWRPKDRIFLVHISEAYPLEGDPVNEALKKVAPQKPMKDPQTRLPYHNPSCQAEWQAVAEKIFKHRGIGTPVVVASDGLKLHLW
jgi:phosphoribosyl 1,2-cyclic phosphate phosphodiesterase